MVPQRIVFVKLRLMQVHPVAYVCIINEKTKGKFPWKTSRGLNWENKTYKVKRCIVTFSRQFAKQKAAELEDFQGSTAPLGEGVLG